MCNVEVEYVLGSAHIEASNVSSHERMLSVSSAMLLFSLAFFGLQECETRPSDSACWAPIDAVLDTVSKAISALIAANEMLLGTCWDTFNAIKQCYIVAASLRWRISHLVMLFST